MNMADQVTVSESALHFSGKLAAFDFKKRFRVLGKRTIIDAEAKVFGCRIINSL